MFVRAIFCGLFLLAAAASAQITVSSENLPGFGFTYSAGSLSSATFTVGSAGADRSWDFSGVSLGDLTMTTVVEPAGTPYAASYPGATHTLHSVAAEGASYAYTQITSDAYRLMGIAIVALDSAGLYDTAALQMPLPLNYETAWTCVAQSTVSIAGYTVIYKDSATCRVDAWGTMTTPYGTSAVLRCLWHHYRSTVAMGIPVPTGEFLEYIWVNAQGLPLVSVKSANNVTDPNFTTGSLCMVANILAAEPVRGPVAATFAVSQNYPNPFNPTTLLPVALSKTTNVRLDIYDATGRRISSKAFTLAAGQHTLPLDGSAWAAGTYFARVSADDQCQTTKMQLLK